MEGVPAFLVRERIAPVAVREGLAKHHTQLAQLFIGVTFNRYMIYILLVI